MRVRVVEPFTYRNVDGFFRAYLHPGVVSVSDEDGRVMLERGLVVDPDTPVVPAPAPATDPAPVSEPEPVGDTPTVSDRPRMSAPLAAWQGYARAQGIDVKGLKKAEIIAAVDSL